MKIIEEPAVAYKTGYIEITEAKYLSGYKIEISFNSGKKNIVDFSTFLKSSNHPSIRKFLNKDIFKSFAVVDGNLNWNNYELIFPVIDLYKGTIK